MNNGSIAKKYILFNSILSASLCITSNLFALYTSFLRIPIKTLYSFLKISHTIIERKVFIMAKKKTKNVYDDDNIPEVHLPQSNCKNATKSTNKAKNCVDPLSESSRPRKDGPGGE